MALLITMSRDYLVYDAFSFAVPVEVVSLGGIYRGGFLSDAIHGHLYEPTASVDDGEYFFIVKDDTVWSPEFWREFVVEHFLTQKDALASEVATVTFERLRVSVTLVPLTRPGDRLANSRHKGLNLFHELGTTSAGPPTRVPGPDLDFGLLLDWMAATGSMAMGVGGRLSVSSNREIPVEVCT
jgi:hypothetical protein